MGRKKDDAAALSSSKEILWKLRELDEEGKRDESARRKRAEELEAELAAARRREKPPAAEPEKLSPDEAAARRDRNRERAQVKADAGKLRLALERRRTDLGAVRRERDHALTTVSLEERVIGDKRERMRVERKLSGQAATDAAAEFNGRLTEHEHAILTMEQDLERLETRLAGYA